MDEIGSRNKERKEFYKGTLFFTIAILLQKALSIISTPIFTRILTLEEYGSYSLYSTWLSIFSVVCTFNISGSIFNSLMHKYNNDRFVCNSVYFQLILTIVSSIAIVLYQFLSPNGFQGINDSLLLLILLNVLLNIFFGTWIAKSKYRNDYLLCSILIVIQSLASFGLSVGFVYLFSDRVLGRVVGTIIPYFIMAIISAFLIFHKKDCSFDKKMIKGIFIIAAPLIIHYLSQDILNQTDNLFIESSYGKEEVAVYSLIHQLSFLVMVLLSALDSTITPWFYKKLDSKDYRSSKKLFTLYFAFIFIVCLLICLLAPEVVYVFGGEKYMSGVKLVPILTSSMVIMFFYDMYSSVEFYYEKTMVASLFTLLAAICNVVLNYFFVPLYGITGAAWTTMVSYLIMAIGHFIFGNITLKRHNNKFDYFNAQLNVPLFIVYVVLLNLTVFVYDYFWARISIFSIIVLTIIVLFVVKFKNIKGFLFPKKE